MSCLTDADSGHCSMCVYENSSCCLKSHCCECSCFKCRTHFAEMPDGISEIEKNWLRARKTAKAIRSDAQDLDVATMRDSDADKIRHVQHLLTELRRKCKTLGELTDKTLKEMSRQKEKKISTLKVSS